MSEYVFNYYQYKKSINTKNNFSFTLVFFVIILLLGLCVFLKPKQTIINEYYMVEIGNFSTYQSALNLSQKVGSNNAFGYIFFDGTYHVFINFYSQKKDAEKVVNNIIIDYPNSTVYTLNISKFSNKKNLSTSQNSSLKNFYEEVNNTILALEKISLSYDKGETNFEKAKIIINDIKQNFDDVYNNVISAFKKNSKYNLAKEYATNISSSMEKISSLTDINFSKGIKYEMINIIVNTHHLFSCF